MLSYKNWIMIHKIILIQNIFYNILLPKNKGEIKEIEYSIMFATIYLKKKYFLFYEMREINIALNLLKYDLDLDDISSSLFNSIFIFDEIEDFILRETLGRE